MDHNVFDGVARRLGAAQTRRLALAALLGAVARGFAAGSGEAARRGKKRGKRKRRKVDTPRACYGSGVCAGPASGKDLDDCDFSGTNLFVDAVASGSSFRRANFANAVLDGADLRGAKFLNANFAGASLRGVDIRGATFNGACLLGADFTGFIFEGPVLAQAILCNTRVDAESVAIRDCGALPPCCALPG